MFVCSSLPLSHTPVTVYLLLIGELLVGLVAKSGLSREYGGGDPALWTRQGQETGLLEQLPRSFGAMTLVRHSGFCRLSVILWCAFHSVGSDMGVRPRKSGRKSRIGDVSGNATRRDLKGELSDLAAESGFDAQRGICRFSDTVDGTGSCLELWDDAWRPTARFNSQGCCLLFVCLTKGEGPRQHLRIFFYLMVSQ